MKRVSMCLQKQVKDMDGTHRMSNRRKLRVNLLNDPESPNTFIDKLNQVLCRWPAVVALHDIGHNGLVPHDMQCRCVDAPGNDVLVVRRNTRNQDLHIQSLALRDERCRAADCVGYPRCERTGLDTASIRVASRCRCGYFDAGIGEDGKTAVRVEVVVCAAGLDLGAEPVVSGGLIGVDDDFVALADVDHECVNHDRLHRDEISSQDLHLMAVKRHSHRRVHRRVDESE